ncbi:uncharacterized protein LOC123377994 isoform X1 [Mauremys mutica]|uniref:uncharacterized protein LOC123377994 isoform X1 n=2 Tax=Mauremys mutica TaxID=74926 RepID=UPI001D16EEEA|nr:uncharacterized protein LOC123377994 isoform X1 [Mauremys mutica]
MAVYTLIFLLFSFLICGCSTANKRETVTSSEEGFSEDQAEGDIGFMKRDLIIAAMSTLLMAVSVILMCCCFLQYKLVTKEEKILKKEDQAFALQTYSLRNEICIDLSPEHKAPSRVMPLEPSQCERSAIQSLVGDLTLSASSDTVGLGYKNRCWSNNSADSTARTRTLETCISTLPKSKTPLQCHEDYCVCSGSSSPASESTDVCTCEDREKTTDSAAAIFCPTTITKDITSSKSYPYAN